ncbi:MAG: hypothetical protein A4E52_00525 [Pelotomaculum sp. PtaB.Bin013]|nr:MAG: hypothetical protein A4E52_00525 [Pelotomaculum sp. PtaB.Bin013]
MRQKPLKELLQDLEKELLRLGYTEATLKYYRNRWQKLQQFADECNEIYYSERLGIDFIENRFHILEENFYKILSQKDTQELRVIRMIGDFQLHQTVLRRYYKHREFLTDPYFISISSDFRKYCKAKDCSPQVSGSHGTYKGNCAGMVLKKGIRSTGQPVY